MRIGVTVPLAAVYRVAGVSPLATNVIALASALAILVAVWTVVETPRARLIGILMIVGCTSVAHHGSTLSTDLPCAGDPLARFNGIHEMDQSVKLAKAIAVANP